MSEAVTRHLTVLLTDIKGFTNKTAHKSRAEIAAMLSEHSDVVRPVLEARGGKLIKSIGDAFLMTFESPTNAVLAGMAVQAKLAERNKDLPPEKRIEIRVAVNAGEVNVIEGDIFGDAVNITARVEAIAEVGQVYFTEAVYLAMNKSEVPSSEVGLVQLKGIPEKIRVYKIRREEPSAFVAELQTSAKARFVSVAAPAAKAATAAAVSPQGRRVLALLFDLGVCGLALWALAAAVPPKVTYTRVFLGMSRESAGDEMVRAIGNAVKEIRGKKPVPARKPVPRYGTVRAVEGRRAKGVAAALFIWLLYNLAAVARWRATPGQRLLGLKLQDGPADLRSAMNRALARREALV